MLSLFQQKAWQFPDWHFYCNPLLSLPNCLFSVPFNLLVHRWLSVVTTSCYTEILLVSGWLVYTEIRKLHKHYFVNVSLEKYLWKSTKCAKFSQNGAKTSSAILENRYLSGQLPLFYSNMKWCVPPTVYGSALQTDPRTLLWSANWRGVEKPFKLKLLRKNKHPILLMLWSL